MSSDFHQKPFDEGTVAKLEMFQLYAREWLPVFLSPNKPIWPEVHIFDFFCGPGVDVNGVEGSPVRIVTEVIKCKHRLAEGDIKLYFHFSDADKNKTEALYSHLQPLVEKLPNTELDVRHVPFDQAFEEAKAILYSQRTANLTLIDPCGVNHVDDEVFKELIAAPTTDFILFVPSSYLHRFNAHPSIKLSIERPDSFYHCHRAVVELYRSFVEDGTKYYLAPFSIKKSGAQIYGLIFGSAHFLGMDKFLTAAWSKDQLNGEANFDINKEDFQEHSPFLAMDMFEKPTKLRAFMSELRDDILSGKCKNELEVVELCFKHGVKRQHAEEVLRELKVSGKIEISFRIPQFTHKPPREIRLR